MKKTLKVIAVTLSVLFVGLVIFALLIIKSLPSAWEVKQATLPKKLKNPEFTQPVSETTKSESPVAKTHDEKVDESKIRSWRLIKEDFLNEHKPLVTVCAHLAGAEQSGLLRKDESGSVNQFMKSLDEGALKDPIAESVVSFIRYTFRVEGMRELIDMIEKADMGRDQGMLSKVEFYTKLALFGKALRADKANIDRVLMKNYNLYILSRAVGKHPELARDPATLSFCDQMEKNLNLNLDFNPDEQAAELLKFLEYAKVDPKEVDFDPSYRSDVKFEISQNSVQLNHIWIEKLFEKDILKAREELKKSPSQAPEKSGP